MVVECTFFTVVLYLGGCRLLWILYTNLLISYGKSDIYLYGIVLTGVLQLIIVGVMFPFGIYSMIIGYVIVYYVSLLYWHYFVNKILPITILDIIKDIVPYIGAIFVSFLSAHVVVLYIENVYITFFLKIIITMIVYCCIMWFGNSSIFKETLNYIKNEAN